MILLKNTKDIHLAVNFSSDCLAITLAPSLRGKVMMAHGGGRCEKDKDSGKESTYKHR